ncbi:MAG: extracellular solute-binding protein [Firmicutes bacterium]|jgi:ABC-type glycerol-3-phosphate transport system substrate-binding protein|nr:extracellular solute-binding protein [Bacillota bacterium]MCL5065923.1 extracellular solute-binding protein [Bacillota bacterium]
MARFPRVQSKATVLGLAAALTLAGLGTGFMRVPAATSASKKVVLTLWWPNAANGDPSEVAVYDALQLWNKNNPNIQVQPTVMPYSQIQTKVTLAATTHQLPDMAVTLPGLISQYYDMHILDNLSPYLNGWAGKSQVYNAVWRAVTINGKIMAMPQYTDVRALLYHTNDFAKAGITTPPKTWAQLIADGLKLKQKGIAPYGITGTGVREPQELFAYIVESGTNIANRMPDGKYRNIWATNSAALKDATAVFQFYATMRKDGLITAQQASWHWKNLDSNFALGNIAMAQEGPWMATYSLKDYPQMKNVAIAPLPTDNKPVTFLEVNTMSVFKGAKHIKDIVKFLKWWVSPAAQKIAYPSESVNVHVVPNTKWGLGFAKLINTGRPFPNVSMSSIEQQMMYAVQYVVLNQKTPQATALWLSQQVNNDLQASGELSPQK